MINVSKQEHNKRLLQPLFLVPTFEQVQQAEFLAQKLEAMRPDLARAAEAKSAAMRLVGNSLVKRSQTPTDIKTRNAAEKHKNAVIDGQVRTYLAKKRKKFLAVHHTCPAPLSLESNKTISMGQYLAEMQPPKTISNNNKSVVRMYHRSFDDNYKIGLEAGAFGSKVLPPIAGGERVTESLTAKAVKNILESGAYLSACRNGYTTFLTLTFNKVQRKKLLEKVAVPKIKTKKYSYTVRRYNAETNRYKNYKEYYEIACYDGIPAELVNKNSELNINEAEKNKAYVNAIPAVGAFCSVEFEPLTTIGKEVSRFFDGAQKMYQRGWLPRFKEVTTTKSAAKNMVIYSSTKKRINSALPMFCPEFVDPKNSSGEFDQEQELIRFNPRKHATEEYLNNMYGMQEKGAPLDYMWVAEMPENKNGEKNPHIHVMMRWQVEKPVFRAWAERLEKLWGNGFAKLERIKTPQAASNYLLKAVGYLTKGSANNQGAIVGNRYNISASARAPKWECIGEFYADNFLAILGELREKMHRKKAELLAKKIAENESIKQSEILKKEKRGKAKKLTNINNKSFNQKRAGLIEKIKRDIEHIEKDIQNSSKKAENIAKYINKMPFIAEFCVGQMNETQAAKFLGFAMRERFWNAEVRETQYSQWAELKQATVEAVKQNRRYWYNYENLLLTSELTWQWAEQRNRYEIEPQNDNYFIDEHGNEWEKVA